jgi:hypothetical protein
MKRALLAATAIITSSFSPLMTTPAFADDTFTNSVPVTDAADETPQQVCEDILKPNAASGFQTAATVTSDTGWVNVGNPYPDLTNPLGPRSGYGTPVAGPVVYDGTYIRNGGSPNVWGEGHATLTFPQTQQLFEFYQDQTDTTTFDCRVWKYEGADGDVLVQPPGLQTTGNMVTNHQTIDVGPQEYITNVPFVEDGQTVVSLICISPNSGTKSKPGYWVAMHGFTGSCTTASTLAGGTIPSNNAPTSDTGITYFPNN